MKMLASESDRGLPSAIDSEKVVIGSVFIDPHLLDELADVIRPDDFIDPANRLVFGYLKAMAAEGMRPDALLLVARLKDADDLDRVGGIAGITALAAGAPSAQHAIHHAKLVREKAIRRGLIFACQDSANDAFAGDLDTESVARLAEQRLANVLDRSGTVEPACAAAVIEGAIASAKRSLDGNARSGLQTGLIDFDRTIGGLFRGELAILAARPREGKTALAVQITRNVSSRGRPVLFVSLEMSAAELATRMLCGTASVDGNLIRTGRLTEHDFSALTLAASTLIDAKFFIDDRSTLTVADIGRSARKLARDEPLSLIVIDYLQRIQPSDLRLKRHEQVGQISNALKTLARDMNVPVLCLAQLNRDIENGARHRPQLSHLRESGSLEQDADVVAFIHRPELYDPGDPDLKGKAELIVEKNRSGPTATFRFHWDGATTSFKPLAEEWQFGNDR